LTASITANALSAAAQSVSLTPALAPEPATTTAPALAPEPATTTAPADIVSERPAEPSAVATSEAVAEVVENIDETGKAYLVPLLSKATNPCQHHGHHRQLVSIVKIYPHHPSKPTTLCALSYHPSPSATNTHNTLLVTKLPLKVTIAELLSKVRGGTIV
jgi:hypothetical protein